MIYHYVPQTWEICSKTNNAKVKTNNGAFQHLSTCALFLEKWLISLDLQNYKKTWLHVLYIAQGESDWVLAYNEICSCRAMAKYTRFFYFVIFLMFVLFFPICYFYFPLNFLVCWFPLSFYISYSIAKWINRWLNDMYEVNGTFEIGNYDLASSWLFPTIDVSTQ